MLDLLEKRKEAMAEYQAVLELVDFSGSHEEAKGFLKSPYTLPSELRLELLGLKGESFAASEFRRLRTDGFNLLYNMNYQGARAKFEKMTQLAPEHPAGYLYLATNFLFDQLNNRRRLQIGLYSNNSFYAKGSDKIDVKTENEFQRLIDVALEQAENALKREPSDLEALYYKGATYGILALYEATVKRSFLPALT